MNSLTDHQKGLLGVVAAAVLWSSGGLFIKLISLNAMQLSFFRCLIAALLIGVVFRKNVIYANGFAIINALFYAAVLILFVIATKATTAANAIFLQSTAPIYVLIFEPLINKTKYEKMNIITIIVCFLGMFLFFMGELSPGHLQGNIVALAAGVAFAAFFLGMRKNKNEYQFSSIFYGNVLVALICFPFALEIEALTVPDVWMVSFLGIFQIGLAYISFTYGLRRVLAIEASMISLIEPVFNPIWVFIGYNEIPSETAIIGGVIIISAITIRTLMVETINMRRKTF